jgi:hypothetical protein
MSKNDSEFISKTLMYLNENGYMRMIPKDDDEATFHIKFKGIRFIDRITDGDTEFTDDAIIKSKVKIISLFQKEDIDAY